MGSGREWGWGIELRNLSRKTGVGVLAVGEGCVNVKKGEAGNSLRCPNRVGAVVSARQARTAIGAGVCVGIHTYFLICPLRGPGAVTPPPVEMNSETPKVVSK